MIDDRERSQLEVDFTKKIDFIINELVRSDFPENDIVIFTETVRTFLKFIDLRQYVLTVLYDKVQEIFHRIKPSDTTKAASYRKLLRVILNINDEELTDALETFLAKDKDPSYFLVFLEEEIKCGKDITNSINLFTSLMGIHQYELEVINKFLDIIGKDHRFLVEQLLHSKIFVTLRRYLQQIGEKSPSLLEEVVPIIITQYDGDVTHYMGIVTEIMLPNNDYTHNLLNYGKFHCVDLFGTFLINNFIRSTILIQRMNDYLWEYHPEKVDGFESAFLEKAESHILLTYAIQVEKSNKRKILKRLVQMRDQARDEKNLVEFIKHFPEYKALLPML